MQQSLRNEQMSYPRHFSDVLGGFSDNQDGSTADVNKLKRRPNCKTKNKHSGGSCVPLCDDHCKDSLFAMPYSTVPVSVPSLTNSHSASSDMDQLKLAVTETSKFVDISMPRMESQPVFDVLCSSLLCPENITVHQAATLSRWLCRRQTVKTANDSLVKMLMASKCPVVSLICCRMLKQSCLMSSIASSSVTTADVISYVLFLQREMVKFLETGQFSMSLMNVICLLDCIAAACRDVPEYCNKLHFSGNFHSRWCSSELRWAVLSVISLSNIISSKVEFTLVNSRVAGTDLSDGIQSVVRRHVERVPQIVGAILSTSVYCEVAQVWSISRILNEYWHAADFCQRRLIVDSVLVPKLRMELCAMILAKHCDVLLQECFTASLSLDDFIAIFNENVVISVITQQVWMEDDGASVASHCREICFILCEAVCSYLLHQKGESVCCLLKCLLFLDRKF